MTNRKPTPEQKRLLRLLAKHPTLTDTEIAPRLLCSRQRIGQRVAMLRHHGWLEGRTLTEAGREVSK